MRCCASELVAGFLPGFIDRGFGAGLDATIAAGSLLAQSSDLLSRRVHIRAQARGWRASAAARSIVRAASSSTRCCAAREASRQEGTRPMERTIETTKRYAERFKTPEVYGHFIGDEWVGADSGETIPLINPATLDTVAYIRSGNAVDAIAGAISRSRVLVSVIEGGSQGGGVCPNTATQSRRSMLVRSNDLS